MHQMSNHNKHHQPVHLCLIGGAPGQPANKRVAAANAARLLCRMMTAALCACSSSTFSPQTGECKVGAPLPDVVEMHMTHHTAAHLLDETIGTAVSTPAHRAAGTTNAALTKA